LQAWLAVRNQLAKAGETALFVGQRWANAGNVFRRAWCNCV